MVGLLIGYNSANHWKNYLMQQIDVHSTVIMAAILTGIAAVITIFFGIQQLLRSRNIPFFRKRHDRMMRGWRLILVAIVLIPLTWLILNFSEPIVYLYFSPSPTITMTPLFTATPSLTSTPDVTDTPAITNTPLITSTPSMPLEIEAEFEAEVPPNLDTAFSPVVFSRRIDNNWQPVDPAIEFANPMGRFFATFSYNNMVVGSQWSALWYYEGELVHYQTRPWQDGTGGYGYTDWNPPSNQWLPGTYEVQLFVGTQWKVSGVFTVTGDPPTPTITLTPTNTATPTPSRTPTRTPLPTDTRQPTPTPEP